MIYVILTLTVAIVVFTIAIGTVLLFKKDGVTPKKGKSLLKKNLFAYIPVLAAAVIYFIPKVAYAATDATATNGVGLIAAALSTGLATLATGYAVGSVGSSAVGAISEDPKLVGKTIIFVGLAEGIAIYGLIVSVMILGKL